VGAGGEERAAGADEEGRGVGVGDGRAAGVLVGVAAVVDVAAGEDVFTMLPSTIAVPSGEVVPVEGVPLWLTFVHEERNKIMKTSATR